MKITMNFSAFIIALLISLVFQAFCYQLIFNEALAPLIESKDMGWRESLIIAGVLTFRKLLKMIGEAYVKYKSTYR